jgi:hypothetical protein
MPSRHGEKAEERAEVPKWGKWRVGEDDFVERGGEGKGGWSGEWDNSERGW